jgi:hypothetical protein
MLGCEASDSYHLCSPMASYVSANPLTFKTSTIYAGGFGLHGPVPKSIMEQAQGLQRLATQAVLLQSVLPLCMLRTRLPSGPLARCCIHSSKTRLFRVLLSYSPSTAQQLLLAVHSRVDKSTRLVRGLSWVRHFSTPKTHCCNTFDLVMPW